MGEGLEEGPPREGRPGIPAATVSEGQLGGKPVKSLETVKINTVCSVRPAPVSYTHLTLPTICSV
eukprot:13425824-Alexandrium_andersonii.AAC.1